MAVQLRSHDFVWQDLSKLGRDLSQVLIVDNSPASYIFHPENAVSWQLDITRAETALYYVSN